MDETVETTLTEQHGASDFDPLDEVTLRFGEGTLPLKKSSHLIGIKLSGQRMQGDTGAASASSLTHQATNSLGTLGGFQLLDIVGESQLPELETTLNALRSQTNVEVGTHVYHTSEDNVPFMPTGEMFIEFYDEAPAEDCTVLLDRYGLELVKALSERQLVVRVSPSSPNPVKVASLLQASPLVRKAEPELATPGQISHTALDLELPVDPRFPSQWHLKNTGSHGGTSFFYKKGADARVVEGWQVLGSFGSPDVVVAVIDDGFDLSHPDLGGADKLIAPFDFTRNTANPLPNLQGQDWHGTACAGVAVGRRGGGEILGAAPDCSLMPVRWGLNLADSQVEAWFDWVRENGAWVVSCSWSAQARNFTLSTRQALAIARCAREGRDGKGCVICFAAGNEARDINDPLNKSVNGFAIHPDVLAIAASTSRDQRSDYSNFGKEIALCAPSSGKGGAGITTADVQGTYVNQSGQTVAAGYSPGSYTNTFGGTSSATPLVAGICGLLLSRFPDLTASQVRDTLIASARRIGADSDYDSSGHSLLYGAGCVDAAHAATLLLAAEEGGVLVEDSLGILPEWGREGHNLVNQAATFVVPQPLNALYDSLRPGVVEAAMGPDNAKSHDPKERVRHFIDFDDYGTYPFAELPEDYDAAVAKFGEKIVLSRGTVPWEIERTFYLLLQAFQDKDTSAVIKHSAWLGHYVGDVHVPFHTTANHDGQQTGQKGLHSYFESRLLRSTISVTDIIPVEGTLITEPPHRLAFRWARESYTYVQPLLEADAMAGGKTGQRDFKKFALAARPIAIDRLTKGSTRLASLWFSAWHQAGRPTL